MLRVFLKNIKTSDTLISAGKNVRDGLKLIVVKMKERKKERKKERNNQDSLNLSALSQFKDIYENIAGSSSFREITLNALHNLADTDKEGLMAKKN